MSRKVSKKNSNTVAKKGSSRPKHVNIADILVLPSDQACSTLINKKL